MLMLVWVGSGTISNLWPLQVATSLPEGASLIFCNPDLKIFCHGWILVFSEVPMTYLAMVTPIYVSDHQSKRSDNRGCLLILQFFHDRNT